MRKMEKNVRILKLKVDKLEFLSSSNNEQRE